VVQQQREHAELVQQQQRRRGLGSSRRSYVADAAHAHGGHVKRRREEILLPIQAT
jgi:hypothetical protein